VRTGADDELIVPRRIARSMALSGVSNVGFQRGGNQITPISSRFNLLRSLFIAERDGECSRSRTKTPYHQHHVLYHRMSSLTLIEPLFGPRAKRLLSPLRLLDLSESSIARVSGSSVVGRFVKLGGVAASSFRRDPFRHPRCGDFDRDRARSNLEWTRSSFVSSSTDKTFARGNFGGPL
jgi:hypothetical protein